MPPKRKRLVDSTGICIQQSVAYRLCVMMEMEHRVLKLKVKQLNHTHLDLKAAINRIYTEGQGRINETTKQARSLLASQQIVTIYPH